MTPPHPVWSARAVVRALATRDLKARYKQSALGPLWTIFQPLALLGARGRVDESQFRMGLGEILHRDALVA